MPTLTIRGLSEQDLRWLRRRAAGQGRSLNREILDLVAVARSDEMAAQQADNPFARSFRSARSKGIRTGSTSRTTLRSDRDRDARSRP